MSDDFSFDHVDHQLGNIGGMIGDAFERLADERQPNGTRNRSRIFDHERQKFAKQLVRQIIDEVVIGADFSRLRQSERTKASKDSRTICMVQLAIRGISM